MRFLPAFLLAANFAAQSPSDFSGVWQLNKEKSHVDRRMAWAKVEMTDATFSINSHIFPDNGFQENFDWHFNEKSVRNEPERASLFVFERRPASA